MGQAPLGGRRIAQAWAFWLDTYAPKGRVKDVPRPVANLLHAQNYEGERDAREAGEPPGVLEVPPAVLEHLAPASYGRLDAQAQEAQPSLQ